MNLSDLSVKRLIPMPKDAYISGRKEPAIVLLALPADPKKAALGEWEVHPCHNWADGAKLFDELANMDQYPSLVLVAVHRPTSVEVLAYAARAGFFSERPDGVYFYDGVGLEYAAWKEAERQDMEEAAKSLPPPKPVTTLPTEQKPTQEPGTELGIPATGTGTDPEPTTADQSAPEPAGWAASAPTDDHTYANKINFPKNEADHSDSGSGE